MGILAAIRDTVSSTIANALGPRPVTFQRVSPASSADVVYVGFRGGLRCTIQQDYPDAPWAWSVEGPDGRLVAFRGSSPTYEAAVLGLSGWLASPDGQACQSGKREPFDVPPEAA